MCHDLKETSSEVSKSQLNCAEGSYLLSEGEIVVGSVGFVRLSPEY
jgi:hypothetical protein